MQPEKDTERWPQVLDYSRAVSAVLGRINDPLDPGAMDLVPEEEEELGLQRAIWELIEFFYVDRTETNGIATEVPDHPHPIVLTPLVVRVALLGPLFHCRT
jgi:hypothetical protein